MTGTANYVAVSRRTLDLEDYIDVARRHAGWIAGPAFLGFVVSICVAFLQPNVYESTAEMQITPAQISDDLVKTTVNEVLYDRIVNLQSTIVSRGVLWGIITKPDLMLYPAERASLPQEDVIEMMRHNVKILVHPIDQGSGHRGTAATFTIGFSYPQRLKATAVVQELVTKFSDENSIQQRTQQNTLKEFFGEELTQAKADLEKTNEELTNFKRANQGRLPEQFQINAANLTSLQQQVMGIGEQLNRLSTDRVRLEAQRATLQNNMQLAESIAQEVPGPLLFNSPAARQNDELQSLNRQIDTGDLRMQDLLQHFQPTYPDVRDLRSTLTVLKRRRDELLAQQEKDLAAAAAKPKEPVRKATNFQAEQNKQNIQGQLDQTNALLRNNDTDQANMTKEQEKLNKEIEAYRTKLAGTSEIETRYTDLLRDQTNAAAKYQEILKKKDLTAQNGDLMARNATERLEVLDPPSTPTNPSKPNRWEIVGIGFGISIVMGLGIAGIREAKDTSLKNLKDVRAYTNLPVLSSIPLLENTMLVKRKKRIAYLVWTGAVILGLIAVGISLFYYSTVTATA